MSERGAGLEKTKAGADPFRFRGKRLAAYIVNYADDLVICCRGRAEEALARMRHHDQAEVNVNEKAQPHDDWVGQLLLSRTGQ